MFNMKQSTRIDHQFYHVDESSQLYGKQNMPKMR